MSIKIRLKKQFKRKISKKSCFFANEDFKISGFNKLSIFKHSNFINKSISFNKSNDKNNLSFDISPTQKILLIKLKNNQSPL